MFRILIVEDDKGIAEEVSRQLKAWNYDTSIIKDFSNVNGEYEEYRPDLVLLDITLPFYDGYYWCNLIRKQSSVPIIFISSALDNMSLIMAVNLGADDFIRKPFDMQILVAKIQAILRRTYDYSDKSETLECGGVVLNMDDNTLSYNEEVIELAKNEYKILLTLMQNKGKIVSREKLMDVLWKTDVYVDENTLSVNVNRLRKKLESYGISDLIQTRFKAGYIIE